MKQRRIAFTVALFIFSVFGFTGQGRYLGIESGIAEDEYRIMAILLFIATMLFWVYIEIKGQQKNDSKPPPTRSRTSYTPTTFADQPKPTFSEFNPTLGRYNPTSGRFEPMPGGSEPTSGGNTVRDLISELKALAPKSEPFEDLPGIDSALNNPFGTSPFSSGFREVESFEQRERKRQREQRRAESDRKRLIYLRTSIGGLSGQITGEELVEILKIFFTDTTRLDAATIVASKVKFPISFPVRGALLRMLDDATKMEELDRILGSSTRR